MDQNDKYLQYLIHEDIYLVKEDHIPADLDQVASGEKEDKDPDPKTVVVVSYPESNNIPEPARMFLSNILRSVKLTMEEVILLHLEKLDPEKGLPEKDLMHNSIIIGFLDAIPATLNPYFSTIKYELRINEHFTSLHSDPLEKIEQDRSLKKILWDRLQKIYKSE